MLRSLFFILLLTNSSCALFKKAPSVEGMNTVKLLDSIKVIGEGRGRLGLEGSHYNFSYDALLRKQTDWVLAVSVPLHGEEVMVLPQIKEPVTPNNTLHSFEMRLQRELNSRLKNSELTGEDYIRELRSLIRFVLAPKLGLARECTSLIGLTECQMNGDIYKVRTHKDKIYILKSVSKGHALELVAENLTDSFFSRTNFYLASEKKHKKNESLMSLELFWK